VTGVWQVEKLFRLLAGELNREAESHLTKRSIRRTNEPHCYVYTTEVEADSATSASMTADRQLLGLLGPSSVQGHVYASQVVEVEQ